MERTVWAGALALAFPLAGTAQEADEPAAATPPIRTLGVVSVTGPRPTSLPTQIPTTMESATREQIERSVNATDSEDALKYFPSLLVRKRYVADYNHAILSSRASGTGNSARSAVYADGMLLSNWLGNGVGGLSFPPRWGLVTPEEIDRVDVMYGPFSAAYPGNSAGAVVDYVTRMPTRLEAHAAVGYVVQPFELYRTRDTFRAWQASASIGSRAGDLSWWVNLNRTDSEGQPLTFATRLVSAGTPGGAGTPVNGAVPSLNNANQPWVLLGDGTQYDTHQDHLKLKLAWDFTPTLRASYVFALWHNESAGDGSTWLRDGNGNPVWSGPIVIDGRSYTLTGGDFAATRETLTHLMHGLSLKSNTQGVWDGELAASRYDYRRDDKRQNAAANPRPGAESGGAGTLADGSGSGWTTLAAKGIWRPQGAGGEHVVEFGLQHDRYQLRYRTSSIAGDYLRDEPGALASDVRGDTRLTSLWMQDAWRFAPGWSAVLGGRAERWEAANGRTAFSASNEQTYPDRHESFFSPKAALSWQWRPHTVLRASVGRAVRMPTVAELYGATSTTNSQFINDPNLRPERSWTGELSAESELSRSALGRVTLFAEQTKDALYAQTIFDDAANRNVSRVQNVGLIRTRGIEAAFSGSDVALAGLDLAASVTYTRSFIEKNDGFVAVPGDTIGKWQPNIPRWRATATATYRVDPDLSASASLRYSGKQYRTLDNSDVNGFSYMGVSPFFTTDVRLRWRFARQWTLALGIDNLNDYGYWNFHPYPQRSYSAELKWDL